MNNGTDETESPLTGTPPYSIWRRYLLGTFKALLSIAILLAIARSVDFDQALAAVRRLGLFEVVAATLLLAASVLVVAPRWGAIIAADNLLMPVQRLVLPVYAGFFINQALPTAIGGDAYRVWAVHREGVPVLRAVASVLVDRIMGIAGALALFALGSLVLLAEGSSIPPVALLLAAIAFSVFVTLLLIGPLPQVRIVWIEKVLVPMRALSADVHKALWLSRQSNLICVLSLSSQLIPVAALSIIIVGLGIDVPLQTCLVLGPATMIAAAVPLSFGGWGVREAALVLILQDFDVPLSDAFVVSVVFGALTILAALPGALALSSKWSAKAK
jgi:uncharacterized membrane protein YbhN (UPF0104 family)